MFCHMESFIRKYSGWCFQSLPSVWIISNTYYHKRSTKLNTWLISVLIEWPHSLIPDLLHLQQMVVPKFFAFGNLEKYFFYKKSVVNGSRFPLQISTIVLQQWCTLPLQTHPGLINSTQWKWWNRGHLALVLISRIQPLERKRVSWKFTSL